MVGKLFFYLCTSAILPVLASAIDVPQSDATMEAQLSDVYGKLPLSFEKNQGQFDKRVKFSSRGNGYRLFLTQDEAVLVLQHPAATTRDKEIKALENAPQTCPFRRPPAFWACGNELRY